MTTTFTIIAVLAATAILAIIFEKKFSKRWEDQSQFYDFDPSKQRSLSWTKRSDARIQRKAAGYVKNAPILNGPSQARFAPAERR
ncbi:MAG: hypothetical protein Q8O87_00565 [bacterium]|nr:hypothetical protein [bacterium]